MLYDVKTGEPSPVTEEQLQASWDGRQWPPFPNLEPKQAGDYVRSAARGSMTAREYLDVRYDVTGLTDDEKGTLALEAQAMAEARDYEHDGTGGHPDVLVEIEWNTVEEEVAE